MNLVISSTTARFSKNQLREKVSNRNNYGLTKKFSANFNL